MQPCLIILTCANRGEAETIARALLEKRLIACAKFSPISSLYRWRGTIETADEILLIMDSDNTLFNRIDKEVKKLHSYKTYTLFCVPVEKTTPDVLKWLKKELSLQ